MRTETLKTTVVIENEMPATLRCTGINYKDTENLTLEQLALFIERDIHSYLKHMPVLEPTFSLSVIKQDTFSQLRISISISYANAADPLLQRIEDLLWSYNDQVFTQKNGRLHPLPPRFQYLIDIVGRDDELLSSSLF